MRQKINYIRMQSEKNILNDVYNFRFPKVHYNIANDIWAFY